ncbi:hypothetical protein LTR36_009797 [Oleoguttula mirabilis]|uniref:glutaminase n=1 Tax=Oleoguttula mirabilis TaxID=1507867 RepID=A0AAV9J663_9PEZI|nr:hypothetical protein LTR36_009797 [Oleoguttula mirabilis]
MTGSPTSTITIGVLALQGAFAEHITLLRQAADDLHRFQIVERDDWRSQSAHADGHADADGDAADANADSGDRRASGSHPIKINSSCASSSTKNGDVTLPLDSDFDSDFDFDLIEVRTPASLARCDGLIIPGGESTSISLIASRTGLLEPLREFVKVQRRPTWGTCAGLILLAESANKSKASGQELIGGLDVRVQRNYFGRQVESFEADLLLPALLGEEGDVFHTVFIRAPVVEAVLTPDSFVGDGDGEGEGEVPLAAPTTDDAVVVAPAKQATKAPVEILGRLPGRAKTIRDQTTNAADLGEDGDIVAVKQGNVFGTAFHPELTGDGRIHAWWLREVVKAVRERQMGP